MEPLACLSLFSVSYWIMYLLLFRCHPLPLVLDHLAMAIAGRGDGWKIKMAKSHYNLIIHPLIKPEVANQQQQKKTAALGQKNYGSIQNNRLNLCLHLAGSCFSMNELQKLANYALHEANHNCCKTFKVDYV